jgi:hypothetical protein
MDKLHLNQFDAPPPTCTSNEHPYSLIYCLKRLDIVDTPYDSSSANIGPGKRHPYNRHTGKHEAVTSAHKFIKGKIPFDWMACANALPGKAGAVGLAIWFLHGVKNSLTFSMTREAMQLAGCQRQAMYSALDALEHAGLIRQSRRAGSRVEVILNPEGGKKHEHE